MPASDLSALVHRTREAVTRLLRVVRCGQPDPTLEADLEELLQLVGRVSQDVHVAAAAQRRTPRLPPSTAIDHGVHVERFDMRGDRPTERPRGKPPISGAWNHGGRRRD